jgi:YidC/Oxa1 family membrane protein insertase
LNQYNNFLGINIANSPSFTASEALKVGSYGMVIAALIIPVLSAVTQWINVKLMPQQTTDSDPKNGNDSQAAMQQSMKTMNMMMPIMSAIFCFTLPAGMGLYWVAGAVMRSIQQVLINKHIDKMDIDEIIKKNEAKAKKKMEKEGVRAKQMAEYANMNTKNVNSSKKSPSVTAEERAKQLKDSNEYYNQNAKPGSMMSKANMVKQYNEKNNKN